MPGSERAPTSTLAHHKGDGNINLSFWSGPGTPAHQRFQHFDVERRDSRFLQEPYTGNFAALGDVEAIKAASRRVESGHLDRRMWLRGYNKHRPESSVGVAPRVRRREGECAY